jgi:hypothetical protein
MIIWGNRRRLCFSGWILTALFLTGLNVFHLIALENQPLVGHSPAIKALRLNLNLWENSLTTPAWSSDESDLHPIFVRYRQPQTAPPPTAASAPVYDPSFETPDKITLPVLSGVVQTLAQQGQQTYFAVLGGRVYRTGDQVDTFVVEHISPHGVLLNRSGRQWHIESPAPHYSQDQGQ